MLGKRGSRTETCLPSTMQDPSAGENFVQVHERALCPAKCAACESAMRCCCCCFPATCCWSDCCAFTRELCGIVCCPPLPSYIGSKMAFGPPSPPSYELREGADGAPTMWLSASTLVVVVVVRVLLLLPHALTSSP